jgi:carboxynorspermidine decarboxylase
LSDHVIFNSPGQITRFQAELQAAKARGDVSTSACGSIRFHAEGEVPRYDPCAPHSRLGFPWTS